MARTVLDRETRRQQILEAAARVFARKGYRNTGVADIIEAAGVASRGTFYLYFQSKEEIFLALVDGWFAEAARRMEESARSNWSPEEAPQRMRAELRAWFQ